MSLLSKHLTVDMSEVGVITLCKYFIKLPPTVSHMRRISAFGGRILHTILA